MTEAPGAHQLLADLLVDAWTRHVIPAGLSHDRRLRHLFRFATFQCKDGCACLSGNIAKIAAWNQLRPKWLTALRRRKHHLDDDRWDRGEQAVAAATPPPNAPFDNADAMSLCWQRMRAMADGTEEELTERLEMLEQCFLQEIEWLAEDLPKLDDAHLKSRFAKISRKWGREYAVLLRAPIKGRSKKRRRATGKKRVRTRGPRRRFTNLIIVEEREALVRALRIGRAMANNLLKPSAALEPTMRLKLENAARGAMDRYYDQLGAYLRPGATGTRMSASGRPTKREFTNYVAELEDAARNLHIERGTAEKLHHLFRKVALPYVVPSLVFLQFGESARKMLRRERIRLPKLNRIFPSVYLEAYEDDDESPSAARNPKAAYIRAEDKERRARLAGRGARPNSGDPCACDPGDDDQGDETPKLGDVANHLTSFIHNTTGSAVERIIGARRKIERKKLVFDQELLAQRRATKASAKKMAKRKRRR